MDASPGKWVAEQVSGQFGGTVPNLLPAGFQAYVRVFHPFYRSLADVSDEDVRWADVAADFGTTMRPLAQFDTTLIGGSRALADELLTSPDLEALGKH